jgi:hypothetical protein
MSPIDGLSERKQLPRLGKLRLGIKKSTIKKDRKTDKEYTVEYPSATDYFVVPTEVAAIYGDKPQRLDIIIPVEDEEIWCAQYYRQYSRTRGLVCKGDGKTCRRMIDVDSGAIPGRETKEVIWREGVVCSGRECPDYQAKACQEVMNLQVILPKVPGLGIYQIDTGSIHSIMNINNSANMIRAMVGRVSWVPLVLTLEPTEVNNPDDGKKKTVHCMTLRYERSVVDLLTDSQKPRLQMLLGKPVEDEAPEDRLLSRGTSEKAEEHEAFVQDAIATGWPRPDDEPRMNRGEIKTIEAEVVKPPVSVPPTIDKQASVSSHAVSLSTKPQTEADKDFEKLGTDRDQIVAEEMWGNIQAQWLKENLTELNWPPADVKQWILRSCNATLTGKTLREFVGKLNVEQAQKLIKEINDRIGKNAESTNLPL